MRVPRRFQHHIGGLWYTRDKWYDVIGITAGDSYEFINDRGEIDAFSKSTLKSPSMTWEFDEDIIDRLLAKYSN